MSNTINTFGKWVVFGQLDYIKVIEEETEEAPCKLIAEVHCFEHHVPEYEQAEANAKLIAAAPELLEACQDTLRILNLNPTHNNAYQRNKLTALINKATC